MWESPAHGGWGHPWAGGARFYKETDWASHEEPASEQHPTPMMSASAPASRSPPSFLQWWMMMWKCKPINPFLPSCFWPLGFITGVTLNHFPVPPMCSSALSTRCFFCFPQASLCQNWHSSLVLSASLSLGFSLFGFSVYSRLDKGFFFSWFTFCCCGQNNLRDERLHGLILQGHQSLWREDRVETEGEIMEEYPFFGPLLPGSCWASILTHSWPSCINLGSRLWLYPTDLPTGPSDPAIPCQGFCLGWL